MFLNSEIPTFLPDLYFFGKISLSHNKPWTKNLSNWNSKIEYCKRMQNQVARKDLPNQIEIIGSVEKCPALYKAHLDSKQKDE